MISIGQVCVKIAGRDAAKRCVIVDILDGPFVLIDGETRRRKCNIMHLEPLEQKIDIKKGASHEEIKDIFTKMGMTALETKPKAKTTRPRTLRRSKLAKETVKTEKKPEAKTTEKKTATKTTKTASKTEAKPKKTVKKE